MKPTIPADFGATRMTGPGVEPGHGPAAAEGGVPCISTWWDTGHREFLMHAAAAGNRKQAGYGMSHVEDRTLLIHGKE
jgi:hypothetical protein